MKANNTAVSILAAIALSLCSVTSLHGEAVPIAKASTESAQRVKQSLAAGPAYLRDLAANETGQIFKGALTTRPGRWRLHAPMALHPLGSLDVAFLTIRLRAGNNEQTFNPLAFNRADEFADLTLDFSTPDSDTPIEVSWAFEGKSSSVARAKSTKLPKPKAPGAIGEETGGNGPGAIELVDAEAPLPIEKAAGITTCLMLRAVHVERLSSVEIVSIQTDKITYKHGEAGTLAVELRNESSEAQTVSLKTELSAGLDRLFSLGTETVSIGPRATATKKIPFKTDELSWGCAARAETVVEGFPAESRQAVFSVPARFWDVAIMAHCPAQMTRDFASMDHARQAAAKLKQEGFNGFEAYFWAPCDFLDYMPKTERFFSGQTAYEQSVTGTRNLLAACHELGIIGTFYANLWGGSGEPAFEMMRRHPDWFGNASFHTGALDDAPLMDAGMIRGPGHKVWSFNQLNDKAGTGLFDYHADQILGTRKMFGWDGIRYDSYYSAPWTIPAMTHIRQRVAKEAPDFLFAYNAFADGEYRAGALDSESGGMIMAEGLRIGPGTKLLDFIHGLDSWREVAWPYNTTIGPLYGFTNNSKDKNARPPSALDHLMMSSAIVAAGAHPYYGRMESTIGKYPDFALRYAEYLYNTKERAPLEPNALVTFPGGQDLLAWRELLRVLFLGDGRQRIILHVLNAPRDFTLGAMEMKQTPSLRQTPVQFHLPKGARVSGAWLLKADPEAAHETLAVTRMDDDALVTLPEIRFHGTVVLEFEAYTRIAEKVDAKTARANQNHP